MQANSVKQNTLIPSILVTAVLAALVLLISGQVGSLMGERSVQFHPPVEVEQIGIDRAQVSIRLKSNALYPLHAEYGFSVLSPSGEVLYESPSFDAGQIEPRDNITLISEFPREITSDDWQLAAWAREVAAYPNEAVEESGLIQSPAIVRQAPMSIIDVGLKPRDNGDYEVDVDIRLTGSTESAVNVRYAISLTRTNVQANGSLVPIERTYLSDFTATVLQPGEPQDLTFNIEMPLVAGQYAVTMWVQRETDTPGTYEHFAQFTYPEMLSIE